MIYLAKVLATIIAGVICYNREVVTKGESGIGWFVFCLIIIW